MSPGRHLRTLLIVMPLLLAGCATPLPKGLQQPLPGAPDWRQAQGNPAAHTGERVRWGGRIIAVENTRATSRLEILALPLGSSGRPVVDADPLGRFIAIRPGFSDPLIFARDREVTLTGALAGVEVRDIGDYTYRYPVVKVDALHLWTARVEPYPMTPYGYDPWYPWPCRWWRHPCPPYW